jgi:hypothetical protein
LLVAFAAFGAGYFVVNMQDSEFVAQRIAQVPDGRAHASRLLAEGTSLLGTGSVPHINEILDCAAGNTKGITKIDSSPSRKGRPTTSLANGFNGLLCFAGGSISVGLVLYYYDAASNIGFFFDLVSSMDLETRSSRAHALRMLRVLLDAMIETMGEEVSITFLFFFLFFSDLCKKRLC